MFQNYIRTAWRNLWKNKTFSLVNVIGLALGMTCAILLFGYVSYQYSYDNFHSNRKNIYRIALDFYQNGNLVFQSAENYPGIAPALKKDFPEVVDAARLYNMGYKNNCVFTYGSNQTLKETKFLFADASFLTIFSFPFIQGNPATALGQPNTAVISSSMAQKMFHGENALGKLIQMDDDDRNSEICKITGVFKDVPENSHIKFNILFSYSSLYHRQGGIPRFDNTWNQKDFYTYVLLRPGTDPKSFEYKLSFFIHKHNPEEQVNHNESRFVLQRLEKIHLTSNREDEAEVNGNEKAVWFLTIIALFILTIAWVNYINLATVGSMNRAKEIGIRKVLGSGRRQLIKQLLMESICINLISASIALVLAHSLQPVLTRFFLVDFPLLSSFLNNYGLIFLLCIGLGAFVSGLYPAFVLSSFKPALVLKGKMSTSKKGFALRKALVIFQFSLSIFLIIGTLIVYQQVHYMLNRNLGMKVSQVLVMDRPGLWDTSGKVNSARVQQFKKLLKTEPGIETIAMSDAIPGKQLRSHLNYRRKENAAENPISFSTLWIDEDYIKVLGMHLLAGRNFSTDYKTDENSLMVTESAARKLGYPTPGEALGKTLVHNNINFPIVGVIKDFHQQSLEKNLEPLIFQFTGSDYESDEYYLVKVKTAHIAQTLARMETVWTSVFSGNPFSYFFLDEYFNNQYRTQIQFGLLFGSFSLIAIAIACIGLFALVAFIFRQRTKEIGVRKVLGATMGQIIALLTKDFVRLILLSCFIAAPLGWLVMNDWLKDFAFRIAIQWWIVGLSGLFALIIALITISIQAFKAAHTNTVQILRAE